MDYNYNVNNFIMIMKNIGFSLSDLQVNQFLKYYEMLIEKNKYMNLTSIIDFDEVIIKHFADSVLIASEIPFNAEKIIDVGTGAGFPGVPLKIVFPNIQLTLLDSLNKRILWLKEVVEELKLENVVCIHGRAEDIAIQEDKRNAYDYCVSRAVANLSTLSEYCTPFVKKGGSFISYKSGNVEEEVSSSKNALKLLSCSIDKIIKMNIPTTEIKRSFVIIKKENCTSKKYPRKAGLPSKQPL